MTIEHHKWISYSSSWRLINDFWHRTCNFIEGIMSIHSSSSSDLSSPPKAIESEEQRLLRAARKQLAGAPDSATGFLSAAERERLPLSANSPYGLAVNSAHFQPLPTTLPDSVDPATAPSWCIELHGLGTHRAPIGIEVRGDVVFGMDRGDDPHPDFDLASQSGSQCGVSRRHALLRPTRNRLYLIDLQSTNGTRVNALPVGPGMAVELRSGDTVSLGNLNFTVQIIIKP
jgi:hypothetical protein